MPYRSRGPDCELASTKGRGPLVGRWSSAELARDNVIDELCLTRAESTPAFAADDEGGKRTGWELLLWRRYVTTPRSEHEREVLQARIVADEHYRADGLGKSLQPFEEFLFRG